MSKENIPSGRIPKQTVSQRVDLSELSGENVRERSLIIEKDRSTTVHVKSRRLHFRWNEEGRAVQRNVMCSHLDVISDESVILDRHLIYGPYRNGDVNR